MNVRRGSTFRNPLFHFIAYGIRNPVVAWMIERGHYQPAMCQGCRGEGVQRGRYGEMLYQTVRGIRTPIPCSSCRGLKLAPDRPPHEADFVDPESRAFAEALGVRVTGHAQRCASWRGHRCDCVLL